MWQAIGIFLSEDFWSSYFINIETSMAADDLATQVKYSEM